MTLTMTKLKIPSTRFCDNVIQILLWSDRIPFIFFLSLLLGMVVYLYARRFAYLKIKYVNLVLLPKLLRYKSNINDNLLDGNNEFDGDHASYYNFRNL